MGNVTLHGFGKGQTVQAPLANVTVCVSDGDCENVCKLPIMCAVNDFSSHDYDVILPVAVLCNLQAKAVVSKVLCNKPTVRASCKGQPCVDLTTADRLSSATKMGTAVVLKPRSGHTDGQPKRNLEYSMVHEAYSVVMLCILCVALIVCVALMFVIDNRDVMFARVLTPAPVVLSSLSLSQRSSSSRQADLRTRLQSEPRQERRQLIDEIADQFEDRPGRCVKSKLPTVSCDGKCNPAVRQTCRRCRGRYDRRTVCWCVCSYSSLPHRRIRTGRRRKTVKFALPVNIVI